MTQPIGRFSAKNKIGTGETLKRTKLKAISHAFGRPRTPCTEGRGMPRGDMGAYTKDSHGFERHKNDFYDRFGAIPWLHHKIINGLFGGILEQFR